MLEALRDFRRRNCILPPGAQQIEGSLMHQAVVAQTPEGKLRAWVEEHYSHVPLREKDSGTKLEALYTAYTSCAPPVHAKILGKILFLPSWRRSGLIASTSRGPRDWRLL